MHRYEPTLRAIAIGYAAIAGFVDAVGFLKSGGLFVSFMTGNSTRLAIGLTDAGGAAAAAFAVILLFVTGVVLGRLASEMAGTWRKVVAATNVSVLLLGAAVLQTIGITLPTIALLCLAMGAANTIFVRDGDVGIGVTYMTGTLVRFGHRVAEALLGDRSLSWTPYLSLWMSLVGGGAAGAFLFTRYPTVSLWLPASVAAILTILIARKQRGGRGGNPPPVS